ncbi:polysaccharide pyruvyl transferase family protein [Frateuria soli]|uniref:polysaccharide pyruvyl transferase family protein n=1 Tax=Frateuria soli TaxID=1542730 RepID=UPI001E5B2F53|nr:polysaccharide pyruvyl transferase family protein [Frateuria soli]UGB38510.1 polysaccharide pyruvyl transferase family protein [Frateuria soli]
MKRFYLSGQRTFRNRGCEAIVRSTVALLRDQFGEVEVLVPSTNIARDSAQWPDASGQGVRFVRAYLPPPARYWVQLQSLPLPLIKRAGWPFPMPRWLRQQLDSVDAVLAVGGDNYSLDYRIPSPIMSVDGWAMDMGKPVMLWGASVGPFEREPEFVDPVTRHLARMHFVAAGESMSHDYLVHKLGLRNVIRMAEPSFMLGKEPVDLKPFWPRGDGHVLGLNVSRLVERHQRSNKNVHAELEGFIRHAVKEHRLGVLLIPHADPLRQAHGGDAEYMGPLLTRLADLGSAVTMMPNTFNAAQTKYVISYLRFFIGARAHPVIAALSSGVPTVSIAYSVKACGINRDLFGNQETVLQARNLSSRRLQDMLERLVQQEDTLRSLLECRLAEWQSATRAATARISDCLC